MTCDDARELFLSYHDGDLSMEKKRALEQHLSDCAECASEWKYYLRTLGEVSGMFSVRPPEGFTQMVKQTIGRRSKGRFFGSERNIGVSFAIISFLLIVFVILLYLYMSANREIVLLKQEERAFETQEGASGR